MKVRFLGYILMLIFCFVLISCSEDESEPEQEESTTRTILVYMVADNSLGVDGYDVSDLMEMKSTAVDGNLKDGRLIVYHLPKNGTPKLKEITRDGEIVLKEYDTDIKSVSASRMKQVISDTKSYAPALDYGLILWSHGSGWLETGINGPESVTQAFGDDKGYSMNITTLSEVLDGEQFGFIYFDCCYMASVEVVYELRNVTPYIIASVSEIPAYGMPYYENIPLLMDETPRLKDACVNTYDYYNSQSGEMRSCTISLIATEWLDELAKLTREIFTSGDGVNENYRPQKFMLGSNCYYFDFEDYMASIQNSDPLLIQKLEEVLNKAVSYKANTPYLWNVLKIDCHSGLSTYILNNESDATIKGYNRLQWWADVSSVQFK